MAALLFPDDETLIALLKAGGVIAYPTEGVMGLGCDPFNEKAVAKVRSLKARGSDQGLICVASDWAQCMAWVGPLSEVRIAAVMDTWPGPVTWVFEASDQAPKAVCACDGTVAIRVSAHPVVRSLCDAFGGALVSTSANPKGQAPCLDVNDVEQLWPDEIDATVHGTVQDAGSPSTICVANTSQTLR